MQSPGYYTRRCAVLTARLRRQRIMRLLGVWDKSFVWDKRSVLRELLDTVPPALPFDTAEPEPEPTFDRKLTPLEAEAEAEKWGEPSAEAVAAAARRLRAAEAGAAAAAAAEAELTCEDVVQEWLGDDPRLASDVLDLFKVLNDPEVTEALATTAQ